MGIEPKDRMSLDDLLEEVKNSTMPADEKERMIEFILNMKDVKELVHKTKVLTDHIITKYEKKGGQ